MAKDENKSKAMMVLSSVLFSNRENGSPAVSLFGFRQYFEFPAGAASLKLLFDMRVGDDVTCTLRSLSACIWIELARICFVRIDRVLEAKE